VFRDDVASLGKAGHGDIVSVTEPGGAPLGFAFYSAVSKIALRIVSREEKPDSSFWDRRVEAAVRRRESMEGTDACRLVFGESDGIPGLVADRYGEHLVVQALTAATENLLPVLLDALASRIPLRSVLARNDPSVRTLEGLPREVRQLRGETPQRVEVHEGSVRYLADPWKGQKTGAFLDQRENRLAASAHARGRVLDAFCYHGSFALHAALRASEVVAVDVSSEALARGEENAALNGLSNIRYTQGNVFDDLRARERRGEAFDLIWVDPPAFAKSRSDLAAARRGYKDINLRAMKLLREGGVLVTSSCSYHLGEHDLLDLLAEAAADANRGFVILEKRTQSRDHPIRLGFKESHYLKCVVLSLS
jgi:23S rRNA (cytosine1962-C5)-methyltransferase